MVVVEEFFFFFFRFGEEGLGKRCNYIAFEKSWRGLEFGGVLLGGLVGLGGVLMIFLDVCHVKGWLYSFSWVRASDSQQLFLGGEGKTIM